MTHPADALEDAVNPGIPQRRQERPVGPSADGRRIFELVAVNLAKDLHVAEPALSKQAPVPRPEFIESPAVDNRLGMPSVLEGPFPISLTT